MKLTPEQIDQGVVLIRSMDVQTGSNRERMEELRRLIDTLMPAHKPDLRKDLLEAIRMSIIVGNFEKTIKLWIEVASLYDTKMIRFERIVVFTFHVVTKLVLATGIVGGIVYLFRELWMNAEERIEHIKRVHWTTIERGIVTTSIDNCKVGECSLCSMLVCPHADDLHLHHDGCPSCHLMHELTEECGRSCNDSAMTRVPESTCVYIAVSKRLLACRTCDERVHAPGDGFGEDEIKLFLRLHAHVTEQARPYVSFVAAISSEKNR